MCKLVLQLCIDHDESDDDDESDDAELQLHLRCVFYRPKGWNTGEGFNNIHSYIHV